MRNARLLLARGVDLVAKHPSEPIEAEFKEVADVPEKPAKKTGESVRLIQGGE